MKNMRFTLIELIVILSIIMILMALLVPALSHVSNVRDRTGCASNLEEMGMASQMYANDNGGAVIERKVSYRIVPCLYSYITDFTTFYGTAYIDQFICPSAADSDLITPERRDWVTYGVNSRAPLKVYQIMNPGNTPLLGDQRGWYSGSYLNNALVDNATIAPSIFRHKSKGGMLANLIFFDGHIENTDEEKWRDGDLYSYLTWLGKK